MAILYQGTKKKKKKKKKKRKPEGRLAGYASQYESDPASRLGSDTGS